MSDYRLLPKFIVSTRSVLNPKNYDDQSFAHAIAYFYHPNDWNNRSAPSRESRFQQHRLNQIPNPVTLQNIEALEDLLNLRINLFTFDDLEGYKRRWLYISRKFKSEEVNLLFWEGRFAWIKHFSRFFFDARLYALSFAMFVTSFVNLFIFYL
jgi:hypothetical protein